MPTSEVNAYLTGLPFTEHIPRDETHVELPSSNILTGYVLQDKQTIG